MNKILFTAIICGLSPSVFAADYTWKSGNSASASFTDQANWDGAGASGSINDLNASGNRFIIGDNTTITIGQNSIFLGNADAVIGDNVTTGQQWASQWYNVTIGKNYTWTGSGDGFKFRNRLTTQSALSAIYWNGANNATGLAFGGGVVDLGLTGSLVGQGNDRGLTNASKVTITGSLKLRDTTLATGYAIQSRTLVSGDLWNREAQIYSFTDENGAALTNLNAQTGAGDWAAASWAGSTDQDELARHFGEVYYTFDEGGNKGIVAHYIVANPGLVPEPSTAVLGMAGMFAFVVRRRRCA